MSDTLFADISEWQCPVGNAYPHPVLSIRSNDGTYRDKNFAANHGWARNALDAGTLKALIVYMVFRPNWQQTLDTTKDMVGTPHPRCAFMIDVESWDGQITGNQSAAINRLYQGLADWAGDPRRVIGYGNVGDLNTLWPQKPPGLRLIIAGYGSNPDYPGKIAHQFSSSYPVPPFGLCDINSADGLDPDGFCAALGIGTTPPAPVPRPIGPDSIPDMAYEERSDNVLRLQRFMTRMFPAYNTYTPTGYYGAATMSGLAEFQRRTGVTGPGADGSVVGPQTKVQLYKYGFRG